MKRRNMLRLIPASIACLAGAPSISRASEEKRDTLSEKDSEPLALQYTRKVREHLTRIRQTQTEDMMEGAYAIARTIEKGGACWQAWDAGHTNADMYPERNGLPEIFSGGYNPEKVRTATFSSPVTRLHRSRKTSRKRTYS